MIWPNNPQKKVVSILEKIETGQASEAGIASLTELLDKQPQMVPQVIGALTGILQKGDPKACSSVISALDLVAEKDIGLVADSVDVIAAAVQKGKKELREDGIRKAIDVLLKIAQKYPDRMSGAVPELLVCLGNTSTIIRDKAYFLLALISVTQPGFFRGRSNEMIQALNGLNVDGRIFACRLIKKISDKDPKIVEDTYDLLEDLRLNHPDSNLRSEAAFAIEKLKTIKDVAAKRHPRADGTIETSKIPGVQHQVADTDKIKYEAGISAENNSMLETALKRMIPGRVIEAVVIVDREGKVAASSGPPIDNSLLNKLIAMISIESGEEFRSRVSLEHADKKIVAVRVGKKGILVVMTGAETPIGIVLLELNKSVEKIDKLLSET